MKKKAKKSWPAAETSIRPIAELKLRDSNPRTHSLEQIEQISASMRKFGWTMPVLVDENDVILAGHGRVRAARLMGETQAPVVVARGWSEEDKRAYVITDNQLAANSEWDTKRLRSELRALTAADFDMDLVGFTDEELSKLVLDTDAEKRLGDAEEYTVVKCPHCGRTTRKNGE